MEAAIIAIGSEMLGPSRLDTNSLKITAVLEDYAVPLVRKSIVGDTQADLVDELLNDVERADVVIVTGGLGPTEDDLTREALTEAFSLTMRVEPALIERLEQRFAKRGLKMPEVNKRQANVFVGQETLANERGTAPGFHIRLGEKHVWVFPGVPHELEWMLATYFTPWLAVQCGGRARHRRALKIAGMTESGVEEKLKPYYDAHRDETPLTILATGGQIELHILADGDEAAAKAHLAAREGELLELFGERVFGYDDDSLEFV
ncbi:MAG TPA: competence/damage-inducible protein A, partial [Thermoanaerobaculia bacterium]|nr:competence/damage-inducible protein A [Thermoanaerobaculia bacterium]